MSLSSEEIVRPHHLKRLLDHFSHIEDVRESFRVAYKLSEILLLSVCGTIADCDDYDAIADWGEENLEFLREFLPYDWGVPTGRWLTIMMNRINPALFSACFSAWVRETWPDRPELIAIDGKTSRGSHDRSEDLPPLHMVSAFATTRRLVLGQEPVREKSNELTAIPVLLQRLAVDDGIKGALVTIDAMGCNATIAKAIRGAGADYLLAVKANQPTLLRDIELLFQDAEPQTLDKAPPDFDKGHGRIETRTVTVARQADWLNGDRRFPGELRLPDAAAIVRVESRTELKDRCRFDTRYYISSRQLSSACAGQAVRGHWGIENTLHWELDVDFNEDQSRLRKGHGATNMAIVRHFAFNLIQSAGEPPSRPRPLSRPRAKPSANPQRTSLRRKRKAAARNTDYLRTIVGANSR
jgi:predicted transposase YbfD/YdcC